MFVQQHFKFNVDDTRSAQKMNNLETGYGESNGEGEGYDEAEFKMEEKQDEQVCNIGKKVT